VGSSEAGAPRGAGGGQGMSRQLALNLRLRDGSSFENFHVGANAEALERMRGLLHDPPAISGPWTLYLWGDAGSGKTHLLEAACRSVQGRGATAFYLPLATAGILPAALEAAESAFLICLDDVQCIAGDVDWEAALFACYELARAAGARLVAAATSAPAHAGFKMPELTSRFAGSVVYQVHGLSEAAKLEAIQLRARNRGFDIPAEVGRYILNRYPRDLASLFALLDRIDVASLASQRRVTIPFLRRFETSEQH
jgi:DnaA-homolog protein